MEYETRWKHHASEGSVIVTSQEQEDKLGDGWFNTPTEAKFFKVVEKPQIIKTEIVSESVQPKKKYSRKRQ